MSPDLEAVLALQAEDAIVAQLNRKLHALDERLKSLDTERTAVEESLARAQSTAEAEEKRRRELSVKVEDHKTMQERNLATLDVVRKPKEATAAMSQVDMLRKVLSQEETDLHQHHQTGRDENPRHIQTRRARHGVIGESVMRRKPGKKP